jgi:hypothetical protein
MYGTVMKTFIFIAHKDVKLSTVINTIGLNPLLEILKLIFGEDMLVWLLLLGPALVADSNPARGTNKYTSYYY